MELDLAWLLALVIVLFFVVLAYTMYAHLKESGQWNDEADLECMRSQAKTMQATVLSKRKRWKEGQLPTQPVALDFLATLYWKTAVKLNWCCPMRQNIFGSLGSAAPCSMMASDMSVLAMMGTV